MKTMKKNGNINQNYEGKREYQRKQWRKPRMTMNTMKKREWQ